MAGTHSAGSLCSTRLRIYRITFSSACQLAGRARANECNMDSQSLLWHALSLSVSSSLSLCLLSVSYLRTLATLHAVVVCKKIFSALLFAHFRFPLQLHVLTDTFIFLSLSLPLISIRSLYAANIPLCTECSFLCCTVAVAVSSTKPWAMHGNY